MTFARSLLVLLVVVASVVSCGVFVSFDGYDTAGTLYRLTGDVEGLAAGARATLVLNGTTLLEVAGNARFVTRSRAAS